MVLILQAKASDKRIAQANEKALHNLQLGLLIVNVRVIPHVGSSLIVSF
jgi:hypothetical protein